MVTQDLRIKNLNWNLLRTFLVIAQEKSISRAADRMLLRQPTVTAALHKLEETLGCQLIQRDSRRFILTSRGEQLRQECIEVSKSVERIGMLLREDESEIIGLVNILLVTHIFIPAFDHALRQLRSAHPSVKLQIQVISSQEIIRSVGQKQAPFGFCLLQKPVSVLDCQFIYREKFGIYCGENHHLYMQENIGIHDLRKEAFIAFECDQKSHTFEPMNSLRQGAGLGEWIAGSSHNLEEIHRMIAAGLGIGILPNHIVNPNDEERKLWLLSTLNDSLGADVYFVQNPEMKLSPAEEAFLNIYKTALFDQEIGSVEIQGTPRKGH